MKFAFMPISIASGLLAAVIGKKVFEKLWALVDEEEPPDAKHREIGLVKLAVALIIEGAIFRLIRGLVDHEARRGFARLTGSWPGEKAPES